MKNFLKKFHIVPNQSEDSDGTNSSRGNKSTDTASPIKLLQSRHYERKPFSGFSNWLSSVANRKSPSPPSSDVSGGGQSMEPSDLVSSMGLDIVSDGARPDSGSNALRDPDIEEEYQIQLALELSAKEDPEAVQIEAVKQISLGSCAPENTPAEVVAYRYWNYNALTYDDKIPDGFYDLYGILTESKSKSMPSLVDLQGIPVSEGVTWEAVLVNRAADANLLKLEQKALEIAVKSRLEYTDILLSDLVRKLAILVSDYMGGTVADPESMLRAWQSLSYSLRATLDSMVLPLGSLTIGLACHRALMFKVLADGIGIPCRLVKGHLHTGSDDVAMNFVKIEDGREYIVDLMADPGTLIPSDAAGSHVDYDDCSFSASSLSRDIDSSHVASSSSGIGSSFKEHSNLGMFDKRFRCRDRSPVRIQSDAISDPSEPMNVDHPTNSEVKSKVSASGSGKFSAVEKMLVQDLPCRPNYPYAHARSPSWTEGISSPAARRMKVKDVSLYMMDAAKENPQLAQKLHDVLLESGVVAPPNLFAEVFPKQLDVSTTEEDKIDHNLRAEIKKEKDQDDLSHTRFLPPLPHQRVPPKMVNPSYQFEIPKPEENLVANQPRDTREVSRLAVSSQSEVTPGKYVKNVPVAAAAAAAAAVVASSMFVAATKSNPDTNLELPVAAAATATAAAVVATTAAVSKQYEQSVQFDEGEDGSGHERHGSGNRGSGGQECQDTGSNSETEKISNRSAGNESSKSDITIDDVAEIPWDELSLGERIGLGSYGEVYRGEWHGTEVAVKRFLDQDISGESLVEFKSEVKLMQRLRHPNVVLFMGAVTHPPNLSIVTEFLPRGSLYRLIHRPNNQLDDRRRMRMALDAARGMNYLHNCSPVIVHRDLKSPNLLVDKNWVVKVCDFGLSRMKHSTFLSSRSTAGTAEWMAPEVLRNEPSDEKCDVYSFGVILWELCTLQQPWWGMNPMQVVGAVGFQHRRLDIPNDIDPAIADIIRNCWQTDPRLRPTFADIMAALKPLQKPITSSQISRPGAYFRSGQGRSQPPEETIDQAG